MTYVCSCTAVWRQQPADSRHGLYAGVKYTATVHPCGSTLLLANIGATEAKVEAVLTTLINLREEAGFAADKVQMKHLVARLGSLPAIQAIPS